MQKVVSLWAREPDGVVELLDATWQDGPEWRPSDTWAAFWGPTLVTDAPPYPGVAVRTIDSRTEPPRALLVEVTRDVPGSPLHRVAATVLRIGAAGAYLGVAAISLEVPLPAGDYDAEIWVDATEPRLVAHVAIWLRPSPAL